MNRQGYLREYFGILIGKKAYVKIYATSREEASSLFNKNYKFDEVGNVYNSKEFEYYSPVRFKDFIQTSVINEDLRMQQLRRRGIV